MANSKGSNANNPGVFDIKKPSSVKPSDTSKQIIVNNRKVLKDPMVADIAAPAEPLPDNAGEPKILNHKAEAAKIEPDKSKTTQQSSSDEPAAPEPVSDEAAEEAKPEAAEPDKSEAVKEDSDTKDEDKDTEVVDAKHDLEVEKLVDSKDYFLPINSVKKRQAKRFVLLGIVLSVLLIVAWADIALDAGLIHIHGLKPLTHFFSN